MPINNFLKLKLKFINISTLLILFLGFGFMSCTSTNFKDRTWPDDYVINEKYSDFVTDAESVLEKKRFSGTILVSKGEDIVYAKGFGSSDKMDNTSPINTIHTTYEIGAITKQFTAVAILQLVESGELSLDDKLSKFFPNYKYGNDITIEMLLSNKSGLADHKSMPYIYFPYEVAKEVDKAWADGRNDDISRYLVLDYFYDAPLYAEPNTLYLDCNTNFYILGIIIEKVTGMKYEDYINAYIFDKAGMTCSNLEYQGTTSKGYDYYKNYNSIPKGISLANHDMNSCVVDLFKWNYSLAHGNIISEDSFNKMVSNNYGINHDAQSFISTGLTEVFNSYSQYYFEPEVSLIVLSNEPISDNSATSIALELYRMFIDFEKKLMRR